ncbi:MAG TPA: phage major capsid protein [Micromonosporaceae bacterium]|nr:phage major capsid protein [Micromonosporaceae bacterium]
MLTYLQRLVDERTSLSETMTHTADTAATENRDLTEAEQTAMAGLQARCAEIDGQLETFNGQAESMRAFAALTSRLEQRRAEQPSPSSPASIESTSFGQAFVESDAFRAYDGHGQSQRFELDGYLETRAPITTTSLMIPHVLLPPIEQQFRSTLLDVVNRVTVSSGVVEWMEIGPDPEAAVVPEGTAKPEAAVTLTPKSAALDTIAHWLQITRQALEDASYIRSLLEGKLRRGLLLKTENDLAAAIVAAATQSASGADMLSAIRVGVGMVEDAGYSPNAVLLNPADFAALDIAVMGVTVAGPVTGANYWGMRPVSSSKVPAGSAFVGDFQSGVSLFDRGNTSVFLTDSHASLFISNILVILAEARVKSVVDEPLAIAECTVATVP